MAILPAFGQLLVTTMPRPLPTMLLLALAALGGYLAHAWSDRTDAPTQTSELTERPSPSVVAQIRALSRLEGAQFHMERIIDLKDRQPRLQGLIQAEDTLLLVAVGDVVAGVDLSRLVEADVEESPGSRTVRLHLPPAELFTVSLDNERTYVHSRMTDVLASKNDQLETTARKKAARSLEAGALDAKILTKAEQNVTRTLTALLTVLGFDHVSVTFDRTGPPRASAAERER